MSSGGVIVDGQKDEGNILRIIILVRKFYA
jgi:hypothetical protein